jgi:hypothetical protein
MMRLMSETPQRAGTLSPSAASVGRSAPGERLGAAEGRGLIAGGPGAEKGSHLVGQAAEARRRGAMFEPARRPIPSFDAAMILLQVVIHVAIGPVCDVGPEGLAHGAWVGVVAIRADAVRYHAGARPGGTEERLRRGQARVSLRRPSARFPSRPVARWR